jgi:hypothetical protein
MARYLKGRLYPNVPSNSILAKEQQTKIIKVMREILLNDLPFTRYSLALGATLLSVSTCPSSTPSAPVMHQSRGQGSDSKETLGEHQPRSVSIALSATF